MFYEMIKEITRTKYNNSVFKQYGRKFADSCRMYVRSNMKIKERRLSTLKEFARRLDVPVDFIISALHYEDMEEIWNEKKRK